MFSCVSLSPATAMKSDRQVLDTALRELHEEDCKEQDKPFYPGNDGYII